MAASKSSAVTNDEQEYASRRYIAPRLTLLHLSSGNIAVGLGFNPPELLYICSDPQDLWDSIVATSDGHIAEATAAREREALSRRLFEAPPEIDLSALELKLEL